MSNLYPNLSEMNLMDSPASTSSFESFIPVASSSNINSNNNESNRTIYGTINETQYRTAIDGTEYRTLPLISNARGIEEAISRGEMLRIQDEARRGHQDAMYMRVHEDLRPYAAIATEEMRSEISSEVGGLLNAGGQICNPRQALFSAAPKQTVYMPYRADQMYARPPVNCVFVQSAGRPAEVNKHLCFQGGCEKYVTQRSEVKSPDLSLYPFEVELENATAEVQKEVRREARGGVKISRSGLYYVTVTTGKGKEKAKYIEHIGEMKTYLKHIRPALFQKHQDEGRHGLNIEELFDMLEELSSEEIVFYFKIKFALPSKMDPHLNPTEAFTGIIREEILNLKATGTPTDENRYLEFVPSAPGMIEASPPPYSAHWEQERNKKTYQQEMNSREMQEMPTVEKPIAQRQESCNEQVIAQRRGERRVRISKRDGKIIEMDICELEPLFREVHEKLIAERPDNTIPLAVNELFDLLSVTKGTDVFKYVERIKTQEQERSAKDAFGQQESINEMTKLQEDGKCSTDLNLASPLAWQNDRPLEPQGEKDEITQVLNRFNRVPRIVISRATSEETSTDSRAQTPEDTMVETVWPRSSLIRRTILLQMGILYLIFDCVNEMVRFVVPMEAAKEALKRAWNVPMENIASIGLTNEEVWNIFRAMSDSEIRIILTRLGAVKSGIPVQELRDGPRGQPLRRVHAGANGEDEMDIVYESTSGGQGGGTQDEANRQEGPRPPGNQRKRPDDDLEWFTPVGPHHGDRHRQIKKRRLGPETEHTSKDYERTFADASTALAGIIEKSKNAPSKDEARRLLSSMTQAFTGLLAAIQQSTLEPCQGLMRKDEVEGFVRSSMEEMKKEILTCVSKAMSEVTNKATEKTANPPKGMHNVVRNVIRQEVPKIARKEAERTQRNATYAEKLGIPVIHASGVTTAPRAAGAVVRIRQSGPERDKTPERMEQDFRKALDAKKEQLQLKKLRQGKDFVLVIAENEDQAEKIRQSEALKEVGLTAETVKNKLPQIEVFGIDLNLDLEEFQTEVYEQNPRLNDGGALNLEEFRKHFVPVKKQVPKKGRHQGKAIWIVECSPKVRNIVMREPRLFVGYGTAYCSDRVFPSRCYNCQAYSHVAKYCTAPNKVCGFCAAEGHVYADCQEKSKPKPQPKCAACVRSGEKRDSHQVTYRDCPTFKREREALIGRTDYGL